MSTTPTLNATFQPQQWINDHAVDSARSVRFDAGQALLSLSLDRLRYVVKEANKTSGRDLDILAEQAGLVGSGSDRHDGPFYVSLEQSDLSDFLFDIGVRDLDALDEETWAAVKAGDPQEIPLPSIG
jgi:hypothetical protein